MLPSIFLELESFRPIEFNNIEKFLKHSLENLILNSNTNTFLNQNLSKLKLHRNEK